MKNRTSLYDYKRKIYLVILPFIVTALILEWVLGDNQKNTFNYILLPLFALWFFAFIIILLGKKRLFYLAESFSYTGLMIYFLIKLFFAFQYSQDIFHQQWILGEFSYWVPSLYIMLFLLLERKKAMVRCLIFYGLSLTIGISHFISVFFSQHSGPVLDLQTINLFVQFYAANAVYIVLASSVQHLQEMYTQTETMSQLAFTDYLTALPNRRSMDTSLNQEIERAQRYGHSFSIIMMDLDNFKTVNDTYGHDVGDKILKEISILIRGSMRKSDHLGRWGGEEFLVITLEKSAELTLQLAERLRKIVENDSFTRLKSVTLSLGVASYNNGDTLDTLVKRADQALYSAKSQGKNRVDFME